MKLRELIKFIKSDLRHHGGTSFSKRWYVYLTNPSFRLLLNYRIGKFYKSKKGKFWNFIAAYYKYKQITKRSCHISYKSEIGENIYFPHPTSIIIGDEVVIEGDARIYQHAMLGSHGRKGEKKGYPYFEKGVRIYSSVTIVGDIRIGENAVIGAKSLVRHSVEANTTVYGTPARKKKTD